MALWLVAARGFARDATQTEHRIGVETAVTLSATAVAIGGGIGAGYTVLRKCDDELGLIANFGCSYQATSMTVGVTFALLPVALTWAATSRIAATAARGAGTRRWRVRQWASAAGWGS
jgi:hypothetical protein